MRQNISTQPAQDSAPTGTTRFNIKFGRPLLREKHIDETEPFLSLPDNEEEDQIITAQISRRGTVGGLRLA